MLGHGDIVPYLLQRQFLSPAQVVERDVSVLDLSRRHHNFAIICDEGPCYLLKQGSDPQRIKTLAREAAVYELLGGDETHRGIDRFLPRFYSYDQEEHILILEFLVGAPTLHDYHLRGKHFSRSLAGVLGKALAALHRRPLPREDHDPSLSFVRNPPWILSLHRPTPAVFREISGSNLELLKIVQQYPEFCDLFDELYRDWKADTLIHRDIKWDNCLACSTSPSGRKSRLKLIDWELADMGDPCWDIGSVFSDYLGFWLTSIPVTGEMPPEHFLDLAQFPLEQMQPALRSFWRAYVQEMGYDAAGARHTLLRAVRYGAARLLQTAYEQLQLSHQLTGNAICSVQLSFNILQRPQEAAVHLLGLPLSHPAAA